ncbi:GLPGLI family protein [Flavobacterium psychrophilum]|uniref:GLPGLI family protein n=1 Tax=Flavobacterium psychrophilum TaxID=96345 RepID=A0A7U2NEN5_FLAPS|nr:GLPGLI family protein [Flavobacterium psychrophilum]EKT4549075.1 GLPGLI family protein [Flavobacterium psychrophilum]ELM3644984.1 GLPGLI family protein [Flavobacterium psychrophilum]ELV7525530.1 GLPGLI family protein [Flavobacterium psychrophilum]OUD27798.1 hypothetical protein FPG92_06300 [Flavobacterium psychrophilum]QRE03162.1 GLPGLI family protein [Flavobacterium psychrophilum]
MRKIILLFVLFTNFCFSQNWIKAEYSYLALANSSTNDTIKTTFLTNGNESVFRLNDKRKKGLDDKTGRLVHTDSLSNFNYTNLEKTYSRIILYNQEFVYSDSIWAKTNWNITKNKKKIGNYDCQEAKTTINGRSYTVWYTTKIPMSMGPLKLHGLPGLIIEVSEDSGQVFKLFLNNITFTEEKEEFEFCKNYVTNHKKLMDYKKYCSVMTDAMIYRKTRFYAVGAENNVTFTFGKGAFIKEMIDVPENLEKKLEELHQ